MPTIADLKTNRNKLMESAGALAKNLTDETRSKFDLIMKDADALSADISRLEAIAKHEQELRSSNRPPREGFEKRGPSADNAENVELEKRAFREFLRHGHTRSEETRDLLTTGNAGTMIPVGFDPVLHVAEKNYGAITQAVSRLNTETGEPISVSLVDDTANGLQLVGEGSMAPEVDPSFNPVSNRAVICSVPAQCAYQIVCSRTRALIWTISSVRQWRPGTTGV